MIPPGKGVFITGTDTDAGKTIAAAAVLVSMRASGIDAVPMKPVQTGGRLGPPAGFGAVFDGACTEGRRGGR